MNNPLQLSEKDFQRIPKASLDAEAIARPSITYWQDAWRRLKQNPVAMTSLVFLIIIILSATLIPIFSKFAGVQLDLPHKNLAPDGKYWFGTDDFGRDVFVRIWQGARISLEIAFVGALADLTVGILVGGLAGYIGGRLDNIIMRFIEVLMGIPNLILIILMMLVIGRGVLPMILAIVMTGWVGMARLVRGQVMQLKTQEFILAARVLGAPLSRIVFRHLIPNVLGVIIVTVTMNIPAIIFTEAFLSFIGIGLEPPLASWGVLISDGFRLMRVFAWNFWFPSIAISITTLAFNLLGDGLRDALDPRLRK